MVVAYRSNEVTSGAGITFVVSTRPPMLTSMTTMSQVFFAEINKRHDGKNLIFAGKYVLGKASSSYAGFICEKSLAKSSSEISVLFILKSSL